MQKACERIQEKVEKTPVVASYTEIKPEVDREKRKKEESISRKQDKNVEDNENRSWSSKCFLVKHFESE